MRQTEDGITDFAKNIRREEKYDSVFSVYERASAGFPIAKITYAIRRAASYLSMCGKFLQMVIC